MKRRLEYGALAQINTGGICPQFDGLLGHVLGYESPKEYSPPETHVQVRLVRPLVYGGEKFSKIWLWDFEISSYGGILT